MLAVSPQSITENLWRGLPGWAESTTHSIGLHRPRQALQKQTGSRRHKLEVTFSCFHKVCCGPGRPMELFASLVQPECCLQLAPRNALQCGSEHHFVTHCTSGCIPALCHNPQLEKHCSSLFVQRCECCLYRIGRKGGRVLILNIHAYQQRLVHLKSLEMHFCVMYKKSQLERDVLYICFLSDVQSLVERCNTILSFPVHPSPKRSNLSFCSLLALVQLP